MATSTQLAKIWAITLVIYLVTTPSSTVRSGVQTLLSVLLLAFWMYASHNLQKRDRHEEKPEEHTRLKEALPLAGDSGVTEVWYYKCSGITQNVVKAVGGLSLVFLVVLFLWSYPAGPGVDVQTLLSDYLNAKWKAVTDRYSERDIFVWGKFMAVVIPYYTLSLIGALLDFFCPKFLQPFKIQQESWPTVGDYLQCLPLVLFNTSLMIPILHLTYSVYGYFAIDPFGPLPPLWILLVQYPIFVSTAEVIFYFPHKWLHTPWAWKHIHHIHHEYTAPIALASMYSHPVEFILSNVMPFLIGPLLCGAHITTWIIATAFGTIETSLGHIGYQIPFLGARQAHDWHHSAVHLGMYDLGSSLLDDLFGTNAHYKEAWQSSVDKNYSTPDYPVDKILASHCYATTKPLLAAKADPVASSKAEAASKACPV